MQRSEKIDQITKALAEASKKFPHIDRGCTAKVKTRSSSEYSYSYADLNDVLSAVRLPLAENGLTLTHDCKVLRELVDGEDGPEWSYAVETTAILEHESGQWKHSEPFLVPCDGYMAAAQLVGSGSTYGKRYTAQNILGLSTESDDDGNAAGGNDATTGKREPRPECPKCGTNKSVIKGGEQYGGGWVCWKKKGGCGHNWKDQPKQEELPDSSYSPSPVNPSGNIMDGPPPKITTEDATYINDAVQLLKAAKSEQELRSLWEMNKDKPGPIKAALHPIFKTRLDELKQPA